MTNNITYYLIPYKGEKYTLLMLISLGAITLTFTSLLLAFVSLKTRADWKLYELPKIFWLSTLLILLSSFTLHYANKYFDKELFTSYRFWLSCTFILGTSFVITQVIGWLALQQNQIFLKGSPSGSFLYLISGLHLLHILGGMIALAWLLYQAFKNFTYIDSFVYSVNAPNILKIRLISAYWHFVDMLWIALFLFFLYHFH